MTACKLHLVLLVVASAISAPGLAAETLEGALRVDPSTQPVAWNKAAGAGAVSDFPSVAVNGFFQADAIWFDQDATNTAIVGDAQDIADFRRARLSAKGKVASNMDYFMEFDFAFPGRPNFMDVYLDVASDSKLGHLRLGQWRQPFGMDALTSVKELIFLERSLPFALVPFRQIGVGLYNTCVDDTVTWAFSGYRFPTNAFGNASGDSGYGLSTRETMLLFDNNDGSTLHIGGGYTYNQPSTSPVRIRTPPEVGFNQLDFNSTAFPVPFFVDTTALAVNNYQIVNTELAGSYGALLMQTEYFFASSDPVAGGTLNFNGGYAQVAYALTGESHTYIKKGGVYGRIIPVSDSGGIFRGAWEIAGRWSRLDLTDGAVDGGIIEDLTFGLNWYLNAHTKIQFNYINSQLERPTGTESEANVFACRAQVDF